MINANRDNRRRDEIEAKDRAKDRILREADIRLRQEELRYRENSEQTAERRHQQLLEALLQIQK